MKSPGVSPYDHPDVIRREREHARRVRQLVAEYFGHDTIEEYEAARNYYAERSRRRKERKMTPRAEWSVENQLEDLAERVVAERDKAREARATLRATIDGLANNRRMSEFGRQEAREEALATARAQLVDYAAARTLAAAALERRESLVSASRVLRSARFVPRAPAGDEETNWQRDAWNSQMRRDLRDELLDLPPEALADAIREAAAVQNHAALYVAESVLARRKRDGEPAPALDGATSALADAHRHLEPPTDIAKLAALFDTIAGAMGDLDAIIPELRTGLEVDDPGEASRRVEAIKAEGGTPLEVGQRYAAERQAERAQRATRAKRRAVELVQEAISSDEADAFAIPISHNPNPSAA